MERLQQFFNSWIDKKDINECIFSRTKIFRKKTEN